MLRKLTARLVLGCLLAGATALTACGDDDGGATAGGGQAGAAKVDVGKDCTPKTEFETIKDGKLVISAVNLLPIFDSEPGKPLTGIEGEIIERFAEDNCLPVEVLVLGESGNIPAVQSGRADIAVGGSYITPERQKVIDFTTPTWLDYVVFISKDGYDSIDSVQDKTVGTVQGYGFVEELRNAVDDLKLYQSAEAELDDLYVGRIDVVMEGLTLASGNVEKSGQSDNVKIVKVKSHPDVTATQEAAQFALAYTKGNDELGEALNATIDELRESGELGKILEKYGVAAEAADVDSAGS